MEQTLPGWPAVGLALVPIIGIFVVQLFQYLSTRAQTRHIRTVERKIEDTHTLVNSGNQRQLELIVAMAKRLAMSGDQADIDALKSAEKALADHMTKQAVVDDRAEQRRWIKLTGANRNREQ